MIQLSSVSNDTTLLLLLFFSIGRKILLQRDVCLSELVTYQWNLELMLKKRKHYEKYSIKLHYIFCLSFKPIVFLFPCLKATFGIVQ